MLIPVTPSLENGLRHPSQIMVDKTAPVRREKIGARICVPVPKASCASIVLLPSSSAS